MILLIDNYDSFIYNIARYFECLDYKTTLYRNNAINMTDIKNMAPEAIVISPGPCSPAEAGISVSVIQQYASHIPILGICLGHQAIASAFGGHITKAQRPLHGCSSLIQHIGTGLFEGLSPRLRVGRYHSLIVEPRSLPSCLRITAWSDENEIMAIQHETFKVAGVQFHPESILTDHGFLIIQNFLKMLKQQKREGERGAALLDE